MLVKIAAVSPPRSLPKNIQFLQLCGLPHTRKNWLFTGVEARGQTMAGLFSLVSSWRRHGHDPFVYLCDVLTRLPELPREPLVELLADRLKPAESPDESGRKGQEGPTPQG